MYGTLPYVLGVVETKNDFVRVAKTNLAKSSEEMAYASTVQDLQAGPWSWRWLAGTTKACEREGLLDAVANGYFTLLDEEVPAKRPVKRGLSVKKKTRSTNDFQKQNKK